MKENNMYIFKLLSFLQLCIALLFASASGCDTDSDESSDVGSHSDPDSDTDADADTDSDSDTDSEGEREVSPGCAALADGWNEGYPVGSETYDLYLHLPEGVENNANGNWAVVFNWHSLGTSAHDFDNMIADIYDNDSMPFIGVTVNSNGHMMMGADMTWNVFQVNPNENGEIAVFDSLLECFDNRFGIDDDHIHSMGFSLGGIMTDMLATTRGDVIASVATYSGGYLSNDDNVATLGMLSGMVSWPEPDHRNQYSQLLCHSGPKDTFNLGVIIVHFNQFASNDIPYLNALGHDVIACANEAGSGHGDLRGLPSPLNFVEFFKAHPMGTHDTPWSASLPEVGYDLCVVSPKN